MNHEPSEFDNTLHAREWQLQELAREDQRLGRPAGAAGVRLLRYRLIARELYQPLESVLPDSMLNLAAAEIQQEAESRHRSVQRFRFWSMASLVLVFTACALILTALYGSAWWILPWPDAPSDTLLSPWLLLAACGALSGLLPTSSRHRVPGLH
jgi:hypothetical protein